MCVPVRESIFVSRCWHSSTQSWRKLISQHQETNIDCTSALPVCDLRGSWVSCRIYRSTPDPHPTSLHALTRECEVGPYRRRPHVLADPSDCRH